MDEQSHAGGLRRVRVETIHGAVEGGMRSAPTLRTIDELNSAARPFLPLEDAVLECTTWTFDPGSVAVSKAAILYVTELGCPPALAAGRPSGARLTRAALRLRVGSFDIEGFVHVPPGGGGLTRLLQAGHAFVALTSVSVVGPATHFATGFLALHRGHIIAAQEVTPSAPSATDELTMSFEVTE